MGCRQDVRLDNELSWKVYAYVSLFGLNSLDQLKFAVFEHSQKLGKVLRATGFDTLDELMDGLPNARKVVKAATSGSFFSKFVSADAAQAFAFGLVRDQLVCLDDFERRGDSLKPKEVLGLVSFLRELRNCKVVMILNDQQLDEKTRDEFETHLEKVVDVSLTYEPTPTQSATIGAGERDDARRHVAERCAALGITNIRTIQRVVRLVETIKPKLADYDPEVLLAAIASLALFCWGRDNPGEAPPLDFIESKTQYSYDHHTRDHAAEEGTGDDASRWNAALHAYGYTWPDEFTLVLREPSVRAISTTISSPQKRESSRRNLQKDAWKCRSRRLGGSLVCRRSGRGLGRHPSGPPEEY